MGVTKSPTQLSDFHFHYKLSYSCNILWLWKESEHVTCSVMSNSATPWTIAHQAPLSMGFSKQEYWSGFSFPSPGDLPEPGIEPTSTVLRQILYHWATRKAQLMLINFNNQACCERVYAMNIKSMDFGFWETWVWTETWQCGYLLSQFSTYPH